MNTTISQINTLINKKHLDQTEANLADFHQLSDEDMQKIMEILALAPNHNALILLKAILSNDKLSDSVKDSLFQLVMDRAHIHAPFVMLLLEFAPYILINNAVPLIRHILRQETDSTLLGSIISILGGKKINALTEDLAEYTFYGEPRLKSLAIQALKEIASPEALDSLVQIAATEKCDQEVLDAIDILESKIPAISRIISKPDLEESFSQKDEAALNDLGSGHPQKQFQAFLYFLQSGEKVFQALSKMDENSNIALRITLIRLVAMTKPPEAVKLLIDIIDKENPTSALKFIVYNALQAYQDIMGSAYLIKGAMEPAYHVRIAAIKMLNNHSTDFIIAEIKKKIESGTKTGENLATSIIDARASKLIEKLLVSDSFSYIASHYLENSANLLVIDTFIQALEKRGMKSSVKRYKNIRKQRIEKNLPEIMVINPSIACLDAAAQRISQAGYEPVLIKSPQPAFERLMEKKPAAIIMGVFLTNMHCTDFINEARTLYSKKELPLFVSSIMDVDTEKWHENINMPEAIAWCSFPPKVSQIKSWLTNN